MELIRRLNDGRSDTAGMDEDWYRMTPGTVGFRQ
jgi:hypothetical protein